MLHGIIQRLQIIYQTDDKLILRELPLLDWGLAFFLAITTLILVISEFWVSAGVAGGVALFFILQGRTRIITFDADANFMRIDYQTPLQKQVINEIPLQNIQRAYLYKGDDDGTQIILVHTDGEELGISVYSRDVTIWKDDIVIAINAVLHEAHKDDNRVLDIDD